MKVKLNTRKEMAESIAERWELLSGKGSWESLLNPLDIDLRRYLIHYGEMAQVTYDSFNQERRSKYAGDCRYSMKKLFSSVGLEKNNPYKYKPTKYFYATSSLNLPESCLVRSLSREAWNKESNWMGYVAVATDEGKCFLGRRDIVIAWRGTVQLFEWATDLDFPLDPASSLFPKATNNPMAGSGWLSLYTTEDARSPFNKNSARQQVLLEVTKLMKKYKDEEVSITVTGHSLGGALGTLNAADIVASGYNINPKTGKPCPVTGFFFGNPHVGDYKLRDYLNTLPNLHMLRIRNRPDIAPTYPLVGYSDVGRVLHINTIHSHYLKKPGTLHSWHNMEAYMHGVAGDQIGGGGPEGKGVFKLEIERDISLVNKHLDALLDEYLIPPEWWSIEHKGMDQRADGTWVLDDCAPQEDD